jgi:arginine/lysine/ornithine decarboxylase
VSADDVADDGTDAVYEGDDMIAVVLIADGTLLSVVGTDGAVLSVVVAVLGEVAPPESLSVAVA